MYAGPVMNRCARIASFAPMGHILTTATVWQIAHQSCSTGRLYDANSADVSSAGGDNIWITNHGWYTFKGVRQPLEIVHIQDAELCTRPFPDVLPRLQRLSSHIADGLRRNEMQYAAGKSTVSREDEEMQSSSRNDSERLAELEEMCGRLREQLGGSNNVSFESQIANLQSQIADLQSRNMKLEELTKTLQGQNSNDV